MKLCFHFNSSSFSRLFSVILSESCVYRIRSANAITVRFDLTSHWMPVLGLPRGQTDSPNQQFDDNGIHTFWWPVPTEPVGTILQDFLVVRSFDAGFLVVCRYTPSGCYFTGNNDCFLLFIVCTWHVDNKLCLCLLHGKLWLCFITIRSFFAFINRMSNNDSISQYLLIDWLITLFLISLLTFSVFTKFNFNDFYRERYVIIIYIFSCKISLQDLSHFIFLQFFRYKTLSWTTKICFTQF